jgi:hypothetical protein
MQNAPLPRGDASRRTCLARMTLFNTGKGGDGVRAYDARMMFGSRTLRPEVATNSRDRRPHIS